MIIHFFFFIKIINIMILLFQINAELQSCEVFVIADMRVDILGSITAHNRETEDDSGFVFIKGKFYGIGNVYLGRAKGAYSRVVFAKAYLSKTIAPKGWTNWSYAGKTE